MKTNIKVVTLAIVLSLFLWVIDGILDYLFFYEGTFWDLMLFDIPAHEIYVRILIVGCFALFGLTISNVLKARMCSDLMNAKKALQESETRFREVFAYTNNGIAVYKAANEGEDFVILDFNRAGEKIEKVKRNDIIGKKVSEVFPGVKDSGLLDIFKRVWKTGQPEHPSIIFYQDDRISGWRDNYVYKLPSGEIVAIYSDETERILAERALKESEKNYRELVQNANSIILRFDTQGYITFFNEYAQRFFGYRKDEILGQNLIGTIVPETESSGRDLRAMISDFFQNPDLYVSNENENIKRHGERVWIAWKNKPLRDDRGKITEILAVGIDITQRKQSEEARSRLETAIEQAHDIIITTDSNANIQYVNPAFVRITGYGRNEVLGKNPKILKSGKHDSLFYHSMWNTIRSGNVWSGHFINRKKDGSLYEEDATISPVKNSKGEITNYVAVGRDVTEYFRRKRQLNQAQKMEAIGTLAGGIAHDFNNILSAVIGYSEIVLDKLQNEDPLKEYLQEIFNAGARARDLVKQILTFSRQAEQDLQPLQVKLIVKEALKLLRASLPATIEIRRNIQSDDTVMVDPTQIHQILMNLCTNAAHAMQEKGGILDIGLTTVELDDRFVTGHADAIPGPHLKLTVSDTGHGMPAEVVEKIFDPFFTTKEKEEGTGMGLAVVHGIVRGHGGFITVQSDSRKGTTFDVYFPLAKHKARPEARSHNSLPAGNEHVLFIDDEKPLVDIGQEMLERQGYKVTVRTSSIEALELFKTKFGQFDLVVTDMTMPNMTGIELAREMLEVRSDIPIILCTGFSEKVTEQSVQSAGLKAFLMKPVTVHNLTRTVRKVLDEEIGS